MLWMASPPEVHSALLSSGPGAGSLLAAAAAWDLLGAEYVCAADELGVLLAAMGSGQWQGAAADCCVEAHLPYVDWLRQGAADGSAAAAGLRVAAAGHVAAVAAMPTVAELAANHAAHAVLLGTNFFGINTIPITVNEADYGRMWVQAAAVMADYEAVSQAALADTAMASATQPAPRILKSPASQPAESQDPLNWLGEQLRQFLDNIESFQQNLSAAILNQADTDNPLGLPQWLVDFLQNSFGIGNSQLAHDPTIDLPFDNLLAHLLNHLGIEWSPADGTINGLDYDDYADVGQLSFWLARSLELFEDFQNFAVTLPQNPVLAFQWLFSWAMFDFPTHILEVASYAVANPALAFAVLPAAVPSAAFGLLGLSGLDVPPPPPAVTAPPMALPHLLPTVAPSVPFAGSGVPGAGAPAAPTAASVPSAGGPAPSPPATAPSPPGIGTPYLVGPPGIRTGAGLSAAAAAAVRRKTPETEALSEAAAAQFAARSTRRRGRRQRAVADEYVDLTVGVEPEWATSPGERPGPGVYAADHAAGMLGSSGVADQTPTPQAAGMATLVFGRESGQHGGGG